MGELLKIVCEENDFDNIDSDTLEKMDGATEIIRKLNGVVLKDIIERLNAGIFDSRMESEMILLKRFLKDWDAVVAAS